MPIETDEERELREKNRRRNGYLASLFADRPRYVDSHVNNYRCEHPGQQVAVDRVRAFRESLVKRIDEGAGLLLFGPSGTGKDHLMAYLLHAAAVEYRSVKWITGAGLFGDARSLMDGGGRGITCLNDEWDDNYGSESGMVAALVKVDVLGISDPLPPSGDLTTYQQSLLYRIVDARYCARRSTWLTMNVKDEREASRRIGVATVDRMTDNAVCVSCDWPSYRKPLGAEPPPQLIEFFG